MEDGGKESEIAQKGQELLVAASGGVIELHDLSSGSMGSKGCVRAEKHFVDRHDVRIFGPTLLSRRLSAISQSSASLALL